MLAARQIGEEGRDVVELVGRSVESSHHGFEEVGLPVAGSDAAAGLPAGGGQQGSRVHSPLAQEEQKQPENLFGVAEKRA